MSERNAVAPVKRSSERDTPHLSHTKTGPYTPLSFDEIDATAKSLADLIESHFDDLTQILLTYESFEVVEDEVARTLDLLRNLGENKSFFQLRVNEITTFLPRNQPLYALACFVIVPSLMAHRVHFRIPHSMRHFFSDVLQLLELSRRFPNITVSHLTRLEFLRERSALHVDPKTKESIPVTDVVIFTGTPTHADQLRLIFDDRTLFISNGAGHNPVVVGKDADIMAAVDATLTLQLYNQGQDCAAPNAILVHADVYDSFLDVLREKLRSVRVGEYRDRSNRVGPISDPEDLVRIEDFLIHHRIWLDQKTPGIIRAHDAVVEPTIICKPLKDGGNFTEIFAPIIFLQEYKNDADLTLYFENPRYRHNAMYVTLYGTSAYVSSLVGRSIGNKIVHDKSSVLFNTHLHARGIERGTKSYGGSGPGASSLSIHGEIVCKATLPQRDIYEYVAKPLLRKKSLELYIRNLKSFSTISKKNVEKLLRHIPQEKLAHEIRAEGDVYVDTHEVRKMKDRRYTKIDDKHTFHLLKEVNIEYAAKLKPADLASVRALRTLLRRRLKFDEFSTQLYALAIRPHVSEKENRAHQRIFFQHIYHLLFGAKSGPRLPQFLRDVDSTKVRTLLDL